MYRYKDNVLTALPVILLAGLVLLLGLYLPPPLGELLRDTAAYFEAGV